MNAKAIECQLRAIGNHLSKAAYPVDDLRNCAAELVDALAATDAAIERQDKSARAGKRALHTLLGQPLKGGAA